MNSPRQLKRTRREGSRTGSVRRSIRSAIVKMAVFAPMPRASERTAAITKVGLRARLRHTNRRSPVSAIRSFRAFTVPVGMRSGSVICGYRSSRPREGGVRNRTRSGLHPEDRGKREMVGAARLVIDLGGAACQRPTNKNPVEAADDAVRLSGMTIEAVVESVPLQQTGEARRGILGVQIPGEQNRRVRAVAAGVGDRFPELQPARSTGTAALEMEIVNDHRAAANVDLGDEPDAASGPALQQRDAVWEPGPGRPEPGLPVVVNDTRVQQRPGGQSGLPLYGRRLRIALPEFLEGLSEYVVQTKGPRELIRHVDTPGPGGVHVHLLEEAEVGAEAFDALEDLLEACATIDIPVQDADGVVGAGLYRGVGSGEDISSRRGRECGKAQKQERREPQLSA